MSVEKHIEFYATGSHFYKTTFRPCSLQPILICRPSINCAENLYTSAFIFYFYRYGGGKSVAPFKTTFSACILHPTHPHGNYTRYVLRSFFCCKSFWRYACFPYPNAGRYRRAPQPASLKSLFIHGGYIGCVFSGWPVCA